MKMEAIVLAGGFGTRLAHIVSDVPKPMAPVCGHPFLEYILRDLSSKGITRVILAVGYKADCIEQFFKDRFEGMELVYSLEEKPLFTGGAVKMALSRCQDENVFIVNGDTFFDVDLAAMAQNHQATGAVLTVATREMENFSRYGTVVSDESGRIIAFREKQSCRRGAINGGIYLIKRNALEEIPQEKFSFEQEYMEAKVGAAPFFAFPSSGYFIDIGIPEDYAKAQEDFQTR